MTCCESPESRVAKRVEEMLERVRALKRGGDLEGLIDGEMEEVKRLLREEAIGERARIDASVEADFPPS